MKPYQRAGPFLASLAVALALLAVPATIGAQPAGPVLSILQVQDSAYPEVRVAVSAADANGIPLRDLTRDNFLIAEDGRSVPVGAVNSLTGGLPLYVVLALDVSGSMQGAPLQATTQAATKLVEGLAPSDQSALIAFNDRLSKTVPMTGDRAGLITALQTLSAAGNTALYDAAHEAVTLLQGVPAGRRAVVLFTDGENTSSNLTLEDAVNTAQRFSVPLYVVGYGPRIQPDVLARLAARTGGAFFRAPRVEDIPTAFAQVVDALRQAYELTYVAATPADGSDHELKVTLVTPGGTTDAASRMVARPGNLAVGLDVQGLPDRSAAEQVWNALGQGPVDANTPLVSQQVVLASQPSGPGRVTSTAFTLDGAPLANATGPITPPAAASSSLTGTVTASMPVSITWDTTATTPGIHTLGISIQDHVGNRASAEAPVAVAPPAHVEFIAPAEGASISRTVPIALAVTALAPVTEVVVTADGEEVHRFAGPPFDAQWTTWQVPPGDYGLEAEVTTSDGYVAKAQRAIAIAPHVAVTLLEPPLGQALKGPVTLTADVRSDAPVSEVLFYVDEQEVGRASAPPYQAQFHTGDYPPGEYELRAVAMNEAGMTAGAAVRASMTPSTRTGAWGAALIAGLALLLIIPMVFVARRRRTEREGAASAAAAGAAVGGGDVLVADQQRQPAAWLVPTGDEPGVAPYPLFAGENRIGRNRDFADIWLSDLGVSRRHAVIRLTEEGVAFYDLSEDNPSMINDRPVKGTVDLREGDRVQIGRQVFIFSYQPGG